MDSDVSIRLVLITPPPDVDYGVQRGRGSRYDTLFVQRPASGEDVTFEFRMTVAEGGKRGRPNFKGAFAQGAVAGRFIYIDVGRCAGQIDTVWSRRMKIPLNGITWPLIQKARAKPGFGLLGRIPGTGKDGGPSCATVQLLDDWQVVPMSPHA